MCLYFLNFILMYLKPLQFDFLLYHIQVYDLQIILIYQKFYLTKELKLSSVSY